MSNSVREYKRIAVIGGGISGLAAAHRVRELNPAAEVTLFEASERLGGSLRTIWQDGFLIEQGADSFITDLPWAVDLCRRIGFADQLISTNSDARGAMVVARGKLERVPDGFLLMAPHRLWPVMRSPILSLRGKLRLACEFFVKQRPMAEGEDGDESVANFVRRRLGREAFERLVQPLVGGIYTADPEKLSLAATLPRFIDMERELGGLIRGARRAKSQESLVRSQGSSVRGQVDSGARYSLFAAPRDGLSSLIDAISARLPSQSIRLKTAVQQIAQANGKWCIQSSSTDAGGPATEFESVIIATPTRAAATLLKSTDAALARELATIEFAGSAVMVLGYDRSQIAHRLDSFGFVVPAIERRRILSASFSSVKFPGRAPAGKELIRVFLGGALQPEMLDLSDEELCGVVDVELRDLLGITGGPCLRLVFRWPASMPQYHLGHLERVRWIKERVAQLTGLALAGNAYEGVGIPQCIRSGEQAAERVVGKR
jgi:protoporphyrinogen/coproporphyrinogen III oxidase